MVSMHICCESSKTIKIIPSDSFVMVLPPQKPTIEINGTSNLPRDYEDFRLGVRVFSDVRVTISSDRDDNEEWRNACRDSACTPFATHHISHVPWIFSG
ncbi:unnamed protein product [Allacma fusca]|uniref:Uncharacterized protein n=1 Tax=Allacma fusca TaxID=39272 RepID=A0A8J2KU35_9HEXA|nr:unnamed protein product [Allacma fusca]